MATEIRMPKLGQTSDDVHIIRWLVKTGDVVKKGDPLCEVENDKTTMDLESFASGTVLRILVEANTDVVAGTMIAVVGDPDEQTHEPDPTEGKEGGQRSGRKVLMRPESRPVGPRATRLVRHLAEKRHIDLASVHGTGPEGLIVRDDLRTDRRETTNRVTPPVQVTEVETITSGNLPRARVSLSNQQIRLGRLLTESKSQIPHYYLESTIFCDRLLYTREEKRLKDRRKVAIDSLFIAAVSSALTRHPLVNSQVLDGELEAHTEINVAFATAVYNELYAPVVTNADKKDLEEIDRDVAWLSAKAKNGKLDRSDIANATFTISNLGMYPIDSFQAIITPPQVSVLAIGRIRNSMDIAENNSFRIRPVCTVWGSFDHRAINGAQAAEFLAEIKHIIEEEM